MENLSVGKDKGQHKLLETKENEIKKLNSKIESLETDVENLCLKKQHWKRFLLYLLKFTNYDLENFKKFSDKA